MDSKDAKLLDLLLEDDCVSWEQTQQQQIQQDNGLIPPLPTSHSNDLHQIWNAGANLEFNFIDSTESFLSLAPCLLSDTTNVLVAEQNTVTANNADYSSVESTNQSNAADILAAIDTPLDNISAAIMNRKKREPINDEDEKRKRNSEASARFRQRRKLKEQSLQETNTVLMKRNQELESMVSKLQLEVKVLKELLLDKR